VRKRAWWLLGAAVIVLAGLAAWWFFVRDAAPPPAVLPSIPGAPPSGALIGTAESDIGVTAPTTTAPPASTTLPGLDGTWVVQQGPVVWAGYRMQEKWINQVAERTVVGRTPGVSGSADFEGPYLAKGNFDVDLTQLHSDWDQRDGAMQLVLDTAQFPTANLSVLEPVRIPVVLTPGVTAAVDVPAALTIHGVTQPVTLSVQGRWNGDSLDVAGSTKIGLADFGIDPGTAGGLVSVGGQGTVEFVARLVRG
jgi:polyisoprenoid-binding protein YceI